VNYRVFIKPSAYKELYKLEKLVIRRINEVVIKLSENPRPYGNEKLKTWDLYRIRIGNYRIIYSINDKQHLVEINAVKDRKEIYRKL